MDCDSALIVAKYYNVSVPRHVSTWGVEGQKLSGVSTSLEDNFSIELSLRIKEFEHSTEGSLVSLTPHLLLWNSNSQWWWKRTKGDSQAVGWDGKKKNIPCFTYINEKYYLAAEKWQNSISASPSNFQVWRKGKDTSKSVAPFSVHSVRNWFAWELKDTAIFRNEVCLHYVLGNMTRLLIFY